MTNAELAAFIETLPEHDCADYDDPREVHCAACEEWVASPDYARLRPSASPRSKGAWSVTLTALARRSPIARRSGGAGGC
jgi:hypothetical protein